jgi:hypothetical protein
MGSSVNAEENRQVYINADELSPESFLYTKGHFSRLNSIDKFVVVSVSMEGSADKIGLDKESFTGYARLRFGRWAETE